ncbi:MAG TPA: sigma-E factor negative regulatory protein [Steroidobacteraceae bacterium]|nr:sigma-E factor negative regulatory protein [Steroidobacteraceae bacterium]
MSDYLRNQLSAFIDGELPKHEIELLFKRLDGNPELRATLARYSLIGESLRTRSAEGPSRTFAERVRAAVRESGPLAASVASSARSHQWRLLRPVAGVAVAATVAAVAILGLQSIQPSIDQPPQVAVNVPTQAVVIGSQSAVESPSYIVPAPASAGSPMNAARLTNYVVAHSEYSTPLGRRSVLSGIVAEGADPSEVSDTNGSEKDASAQAPADLAPAQQ